MPNLRNLLFGYAPGTTVVPGEFMVFNTNQTALNEGCCCLWTVPANTTFAIFEMWSGGGGGYGSCCCQQGQSAGSGGYAIKTCTVAPGQQIRICAAGSTCCVQNCDSGAFCGCCTFVCSLGGGGQPTWEAKVCGGRGVTGVFSCFWYNSCYNCCTMCFCCGGIGSNVDFFIPGTTGGGNNSQYCIDSGITYRANAPMTAGGPAPGPNGCCGWGGSNAYGIRPGGGGGSAQTHGNVCCYGGPGAGGMVYVLFF